MGFHEGAARAVQAAFRRLGRPATYIPSKGEAKEITAIAAWGEDLGEGRLQASMQASATVSVLEAEVLDPAYQDSIVIDGEAWTVIKKLGRSAGRWKLECRRDVRPTFKRG